jgi:L,D-peptidoglycan transpeptidase YkuD (ErfK/YbiS/YcfS/YnhG family)
VARAAALALLIGCAAPALALSLGASAAPQSEPAPPSAEDLVVESLRSVHEGRLDDALRQLETALQVDPQFRLAQLIKGDLLLARSRPLAQFGGDAKAPAADIEALRQEARARLERRQPAIAAQHLPRYLVQLPATQRYALVVDAATSTLRVFHNDGVRLTQVADYYVTVGRNGVDKRRQGDKRTPLGVYHVVARVPGRQLTDFYGSGAWALDYPSAWDRRMGRGGHGIWLHGTPPGTYSRPPRASDGCLVLSNPDLDEIGRWLQPGLTPVVIAEQVDWVSNEEIAVLRAELTRAFDGWRLAWNAGDAEALAAAYDPDFAPGPPAAFVRRVGRQLRSGSLRVSQLSILLQPGTEDLAVVSFVQDDRSSRQPQRVRQYWRRAAGAWRIIEQTTAPRAATG